MLLSNLDLLFRDTGAFFLLLALVGTALLVGITVHEFSHAAVSHLLGDSLARRQGRLTLNPIAHLDPLGTAMLLLAGFGWGKPVPVDPSALRPGPRAMALVAAAGPVSNFACAALFAVPLRASSFWHWWPRLIGFTGATGPDILASLLGFLVVFNLILGVFNLLPFYPLDGWQVALGLLPRRIARRAVRLAVYGPVLLLVVIAVDYLTRWGLLWRVMGPVVNYLSTLLAGGDLL